MTCAPLYFAVAPTSISLGGQVATSVEKVCGCVYCSQLLPSFLSYPPSSPPSIFLSLIDKGKVDIIKKTGAEIGKQAAARSGGLFAAEDWQCSV